MWLRRRAVRGVGNSRGKRPGKRKRRKSELNTQRRRAHPTRRRSPGRMPGVPLIFRSNDNERGARGPRSPSRSKNKRHAYPEPGVGQRTRRKCWRVQCDHDRFETIAVVASQHTPRATRWTGRRRWHAEKTGERRRRGTVLTGAGPGGLQPTVLDK